VILNRSTGEEEVDLAEVEVQEKSGTIVSGRNAVAAIAGGLIKQ
jgi:hypothetical protein